MNCRVCVSVGTQREKKRNEKLSRFLFSGSNVYKIYVILQFSYNVYTGKMKASAGNKDEQKINSNRTEHEK